MKSVYYALLIVVLLSFISNVEVITTIVATAQKTITIGLTLNAYETLTTQKLMIRTATLSVSELLTTQKLMIRTVTLNAYETITLPRVASQLATVEVYEGVGTRTTQTTTSVNADINVNEQAGGGGIRQTLTYTYPYTNPYAPKTPQNCLSVEPTQVSETLYKYVTNGKFHIHGSFKNLSSLSLVIYPNPNIYGQYQQVCNNLYYCGFRSSLWLLFSNDTKTLFVSVNTINYPAVTNRTSVDVYYFNIELKEEVRDFSGIGSLVVWLAHIVTFNDKYNVVTDYELPLWSAFYQRENDKFPFPIEIYSTSSSLYVYDCGTTTQMWLCPSDNPIVCALWSFARIIYNLLPDPIKALIGVISGLGNIVVSLITYITNPQIISIIVTFIPFTFLLLFTILTLRGGIVGVMQFFVEVFELLKKIGEFIINVFRSIIP